MMAPDLAGCPIFVLDMMPIPVGWLIFHHTPIKMSSKCRLFTCKTYTYTKTYAYIHQEKTRAAKSAIGLWSGAKKAMRKSTDRLTSQRVTELNRLLDVITESTLPAMRELQVLLWLRIRFIGSHDAWIVCNSDARAGISHHTL